MKWYADLDIIEGTTIVLGKGVCSSSALLTRSCFCKCLFSLNFVGCCITSKMEKYLTGFTLVSYFSHHDNLQCFFFKGVRVSIHCVVWYCKLAIGPRLPRSISCPSGHFLCQPFIPFLKTLSFPHSGRNPNLASNVFPSVTPFPGITQS